LAFLAIAQSHKTMTNALWFIAFGLLYISAAWRFWSIRNRSNAATGMEPRREELKSSDANALSI
jgi:hypothetical protein